MDKNLTDKEIITSMTTCQSITEWNATRESYKAIRGMRWIAANLDSGLIGKTSIKDPVEPTRININTINADQL